MRFALAPVRSILSLLLVAALASCGGESSAPTDDNATAVPPAVVYTVRGVIADLPAEGQPQNWMAVQHEAIPDFIGIDGEPEPMHAMTMPFPLAEGVDLGASTVGDKIAFELEIDWNAGEPARILGLSSLSPDTELELGGM